MESFRTADGRTLSYRREGSGPLLVCHPGGPGFSSRYFGDLAGLGLHADPSQPPRQRRLRPPDRPAGIRDGRLRIRSRRAACSPRARADASPRTLARRRGGSGVRGRLSRPHRSARPRQHPRPIRPGAACGHGSGREGQGRQTVVGGRARRAGGRAGGPVRERRGARRARAAGVSPSTSGSTAPPRRRTSTPSGARYPWPTPCFSSTTRSSRRSTCGRTCRRSRRRRS
jgi:hypothetical protein